MVLRVALRFVSVVVLESLALTLSLPAQTVRGRVVDSLSGTPVGRGFVVLLDQTGHAVARTLTSGTAEFLIRAPTPGRYRLRSELIGYRAAESGDLLLDSGTMVEYTFEIVPLPIVLGAVKVQTETRCNEDPALAAATAMVWEEIRKALEAAAWDGTQRLVRYRYYRFERDLSTDRRHTTREAGQVVDGTANRPFGSLPAEQLERDGYIVTRPDEIHYALPDAEVLLHPAFLSTHCFHVVRDAKKRRGEIGLAFKPVEHRQVAEVRGTMWLDETTSELRTLEIVYTELPEGLKDDRGGGTVEFLRLPLGAWIVQRWELRTPVIGVVQRDPKPYEHAPRTRARVAGWRDFGGEVLEITTGERTVVYPSNLSHVQGTVYDSTRCNPLAGAVVGLDGTPFSAPTDRSGRFHLAVPVQGEYALTVAHSWLDSIGYRPPPQEITLARGAVDTVAIAIPPPTVSRRCRIPSDSGGAAGVRREQPAVAQAAVTRHPDGARSRYHPPGTTPRSGDP